MAGQYEGSTKKILTSLFVKFYGVVPEIQKTPVVPEAITLLNKTARMSLEPDFEYLIKVNETFRQILSELSKGNELRAKDLSEQWADIMAKAAQCITMQSKYSADYQTMVTEVNDGLKKLFEVTGRPTELNEPERKTEVSGLQKKLSAIKSKVTAFFEKTSAPTHATVIQVSTHLAALAGVAATHVISRKFELPQTPTPTEGFKPE